ncbi:putative Ig domain-containing protein [Larkinella humicola]|uniref:T9SS type A sorting domain-containing protein n=1 Tax=Larkinella humicola TaxID=2607654 RepID=A0A5N1JF91_9BACT|nr:putative Ig domain-containing protein [Larkinella humicola]KAA9353095.1 T9SS type A sorting domain-containing protein [Larkinella humicola]
MHSFLIPKIKYPGFVPALFRTTPARWGLVFLLLAGLHSGARAIGFTAPIHSVKTGSTPSKSKVGGAAHFGRTRPQLANPCSITMAAPASQTLCAGSTTAPVPFTGNGTVYRWTNSNPSIGLPASGTGTIDSFTALNTTPSTQTATITVTPLGQGPTLAYTVNNNYRDYNDQVPSNISVIDVATNTVLPNTIPLPGRSPSGMAVSPNGTLIYVGNYLSDNVTVIDAVTQTVLTTIEGIDGPTAVAFSSDGTRVFVGSFNSPTVSVIDVATNTITATIQVEGEPNGGAVMSPDGKRVYFTMQNLGNPSYGFSVAVIDVATQTSIATIPVPDGAGAICITPDGTRLYTTSVLTNKVTVINTATNTVSATIETVQYGFQFSLVVSLDGQRVYVSTNPKRVTVIDVATNTVSGKIDFEPFSPAGLGITPDGSKIYAVEPTQDRVSVIDVATNTVLPNTIPVGNNPSFGGFGTIPCEGPSQSFTITVDPAVTASITPSSPTLCAGSSTTLTATGSPASGTSTYRWNTGATTSTLPVSTSGPFSVTVTTGSCSATASTSVTVNTPPTVSISPSLSTTVIQGQSASLTASGADSYRWSTGETSPIISVSVAGPYSVTGTTAGCSGSSSVTLVVTNPASASLSGSTTLCPGQPATLSVDLTGTAPWSLTYTDGTTPVTLDGITSSPYTFTVNPAATTTFNLLAVASSEAPTGGTVSGSATVTRPEVPPVPTLTPSSTSVIQNTPNVTLTISGCPGALSWSGSNATSGTGTTISVPTSAIGTIVYSASCVSTCPGVPGSATVTVTTPTATGSFDGFVNGADCGSFRGWAWDRGKGNTAVSVEILDGSTVIGTLLAGDFRQDLLDAGKGNGKHGFRFTIPESIKDGLSHTLSARVAGSSFILKDSPKALICQGSSTPSNKAPVPPSPTVLVAPLSAQVGVPFSGTLVPFTDPEGQPLTYALTGLPDGLSINMTSRVIAGTPTQSGSFVLTYSANDGVLTNSVSFPLTVNPESMTTVTGSFEGYLDKVECGSIRGWVWDRNKPNTPVTVEFYTSSAVLGSVVANIYRADLKTAGKGNGVHAYSFEVPANLKDGTMRVIYGRVQGSTYVLKDSGKPLTCNSPIRLSAESSPELQVKVLGNPAHDEIKVEIRGAEGQPLRLQLTDASGRLVSQRLIEMTKPVEQQSLSVQQQPAGLLLLRVTSGVKSVTMKIVKQ